MSADRCRRAQAPTTHKRLAYSGWWASNDIEEVERVEVKGTKKILREREAAVLLVDGDRLEEMDFDKFYYN